MNKVLRLLWIVLLICGSASALPALKGGTWQELSASTNAINGTVPQADGATVPVYQGSILLTPGKTHVVGYNAMPRDFSVDDTSYAMQVVNPRDTEGDLFAFPPLQWENQQPPVVGLIWADAATPDEPLNPQPVANKSFCAQNLAGRHFVAWPEIETSESTTVPQLFFVTSTGVPDRNILTLLQQKIAIDIAPAEGQPVLVSADHIDDALQAAKVKAGESINLSITTQGCDGNVVANAPFVIRREDAKNRKNEINNNQPIHVGDTELTTPATLYRGTTDAQGKAMVVVTQPDGPGVKTHLFVSSETYPDLSAGVDVIFTTLTSPDSEQAAMFGHMPESVTATLDGETYTFTRPKLVAETSGTSGSLGINNETWAQFTWSGADNHCAILPDAEQLVAMRSAHNTVASYPGWPIGEYWSSTKDQLSEYHYATMMDSGSVVRESDSGVFLASCVDKALPLANPQITLSPDAPYKAEVGETIELVASVVDKNTQKPLPYRYVELFVDPASNRKGEHKDEWDNQRVVIRSDDMRASSPEHYTGVTDANGLVHLSLSHDSGTGVKTPIRIVMEGAEGSPVTLPFEVTFTVVTSPDVDGANMYGHMQGVVDAGNLYKRPLLASEASHKTGLQSENNEEWATFDSVAAATSQCGSGQVPDTGSLEHLYGEHPDNQMLTEHGWPTEPDAYIAADSAQMAYVNLKDGSKGTGGTTHYLTCSANEMVAVLDVYFNDDVSLRTPVAKVGEQIKMNVHSRNALNGAVVANVDFTATLSLGKRRDGLSTGFTDASQGELLFDNVAYGAGASSMTYQGMTDANGDAEIIIEQPRGVGLLTPLDVAPVDSLITTPVSRSVKFTVATSPDTPNAKMWGHMAETITVDNLTFERPRLAAEVSASRTQDETNETWARVYHADAAGNTGAGGCAVNRLPRIDQMEALYAANSGGAIHTTQGWPVLINYWSSSMQSATTWKLIALSNGSEFTASDVSDYVSCLASDNPVAASITLEPVDTSLWYNNNTNSVHALKVKKGDTLQLKVTVKDASGNPLPSAPFVISRGDGYTRQNVKHTAGSGDGIVSPVVIDGQSLNDIATKIGAITGADGSKIISVTRPDTHGTKVGIIAALHGNATVSASIETIFTVVTSPDSDKANMWGHMQASLTAADGAEYRRPLLYAELSDTRHMMSYTEDNEAWARYYGPYYYRADTQMCKEGYYPSVDGLDSLYRKYPGRSIKTAQGWPIDYSYWSGGYTSAFSTEVPVSFYAVDLDDGSHHSVSSTDTSAMQYQICSTTPTPLAKLITLTSTAALDETAQAVKAKVGERVPLVITTRDASGNPVGNSAFTLTRDQGLIRGSYALTSWTIPTMQLLLTGQASREWLYDGTYYGVTGSDGTLSLEVGEDNGPGLKNVLTASVYKTATATSSLSTVFTVLTSPDSNKAQMWGHMSETFTASNGAEFMRPRLKDELGSTTDTNSVIQNNEMWYTVKNVNSGRGACTMDQMPTASDYTSLYDDHPNGALAADFGFPMISYGWWTGDKALSGQSLLYQMANLRNGDILTTTSPSAVNVAQLCLTAKREFFIALDSTASWNETYASFMAKKGETLPMTVTVTDASGRPQANTLVLLSRASSYSRNNLSLNSSPAYMLLTPVSPAGSVVSFTANSSKWYAVTGDDGTVQFTLAQNDSFGFKTAITASLVEGTLATISKDVIFTVNTSPDVASAVYWGHMPETLNVEGTFLHRPRLSSEAGVSGGPTENGEKWAYVYAATNSANYDYTAACGGVENAPDKTVLESARTSQIAANNGWPVETRYLSSTKDGSNGYCGVSLSSTGYTQCTYNSGNSGLIACLAQP